MQTKKNVKTAIEIHKDQERMWADDFNSYIKSGSGQNLSGKQIDEGAGKSHDRM